MLDCTEVKQLSARQELLRRKAKTERVHGNQDHSKFPQHHTFIYDAVQRETVVRWRIINTQKLKETTQI